MLKRMFIVIIFTLLPIITTGCWNRKELNTLAIVKCVGIDLMADGQISLATEIIKPGGIKKDGGKGGDDNATWVSISTGATTFDAVRNATFDSPRKLFWAQDKVIIIGEEAAKMGIAPLLDLYDRNHERSRRAKVFIAKGKAQDIIEGKNEQEKVLGQAIEELALTSGATSKVAKIDVHDLLKTLASKTSDPFIPGIEIVHKEKEGEVQNLIRLDGTAILKKDKLIGWFDNRETRGLLWILGKVSTGIIVVPSPLTQKGKVSLEIMHASSSVKPEFVDGKLVIVVEIEEEGNLGEEMSQGDLTQPEAFSQLEQAQEAVIEAEVNAALRKGQQQWGVDIFKFGDAVHRKFPVEWAELEKSWGDEFPTLDVKVQVKTQLRRFGMRTAPEKIAE